MPVCGWPGCGHRRPFQVDMRRAGWALADIVVPNPAGRFQVVRGGWRAIHHPTKSMESKMSTSTSTTRWKGTCHCGAVQFEVHTAIEPAGRCNCSLCRRKGALMSPPFEARELTILAGEDALTLYQFNT